MRIVFFDVQSWERATIRKAFGEHELTLHKESLCEETVHLAAEADIVSIFIYSTVTGEMLTQCPQLKCIATRSTGFDHISNPGPKGAMVCNVPFYGEHTVAEHTFALILSLSRNIHKSYVRTLKSDFSIEGLKGFDLKGKTLGIVGAGHIGLHVIRMAKGFGMEVIAHDHHPTTFLSEVLGFRYCSLEEVLSQSDIVSLHVPYTPHTHHLINKDSIATMKKGALLINTSRGAVVSTVDLLSALESGHIAGAGLDVLEGEDLIRDEKRFMQEHQSREDLAQLLHTHLLLQMEQVVFTPHIAFYSQEALERIMETTCTNIQNFIAGTPSYVVTYK